MPELRQNVFTKEWVIIATERAKRPEQLATHRSAQEVPAFVETARSVREMKARRPPEVMRQSTNGGPWEERVIPNKFATLTNDLRRFAACSTCGGGSADSAFTR